MAPRRTASGALVPDPRRHPPLGTQAGYLLRRRRASRQPRTRAAGAEPVASWDIDDLKQDGCRVPFEASPAEPSARSRRSSAAASPKRWRPRVVPSSFTPSGVLAAGTTPTCSTLATAGAVVPHGRAAASRLRPAGAVGTNPCHHGPPRRHRGESGSAGQVGAAGIARGGRAPLTGRWPAAC